MSDIKYVLYCRKSTDESSGKQAQSIPDQIRACVKYAKDNGLSIMKKPKDFSLFESKQEIGKENNEVDLKNRETYINTRYLYIIKEQESAKIPHNRPKWKELIKLIKAEKIRGVISYSPDRQARNLLEAGELIDLVDKNKLPENKKIGKIILDLKYPNFHFDDNASGKMMLGIWFVFSKQYSDKLSEDIGRGNKSKLSGGKALGRHKMGYIINKEGYHEPHPEFFDLMREVFELKIYQKKSDDYLKNFLNSRGYHREYKSGKKEPLRGKNLYKVWLDDFYYGIYIHGNEETDLRETNPYFKPLISESEFKVLFERHNNNNISSTLKERNEKYDEIIPLERGLVRTPDNFAITDYLPNPKRFDKKLEKLRLEGKDVSLKDIVKPSQIRYKCTNKNSKHNGLEIKYEVIDKAIYELFKRIKIDDTNYKDYEKYIQSKLEKIMQEKKEKETSLKRQKNRLENDRDKYILENAGRKKDDDEKRIYEGEKARHNKEIDNIKKQIEDLDIKERNEILEFEIFSEILGKSHLYWKSANYVQKRKIAKIIISNIKITSNNELHIAVIKGLENLFSLNGRNKAEKL